MQIAAVCKSVITKFLELRLTRVERATIEASITQTSSPPISFLEMSVCIYNLHK